MESKSELNNLELPGTSSEDQSELGYGNLTESQPDCSVLSLSSEVSPLNKRNIPQTVDQSIIVDENSTYSESDLTSTLDSLQVSHEALEATNETKELYLDFDDSYIQSNQDNSSQPDELLTPAANSKTTNSFYTDPKPGTSSECVNEQNIELVGSETEASSFGTGITSTLSNQENSSQQKNTCAQKRRGRKRKEDFVVIKPSRESQRKKKTPKVFNIQNENRTTNVWSAKDKRDFLKALEKWGPDNLNALEKELPNKRRNQIVNQIRYWREAAHADVKRRLETEVRRSENAMVNCISRLDEWIEHFAAVEEASPNKLFALSNVFLLIAEYGDFPPPSECNGVDYRAMYRYIHCMLNGTPYFGVNQATAKVLYDSINNLFAFLKDHHQVSNLQPHLLGGNLKVKPRCRTYGRPLNQEATLKNPNSIVNLPNINPLNIPQHILAKFNNRDGGDDDAEEDDEEEDESDEMT